MPAGEEYADPGAMSATNLVPPAVPSLRHSSFPCVTSFAEKYSGAPTFNSQTG
jgi:hypothetical protein